MIRSKTKPTFSFPLPLPASSLAQLYSFILSFSYQLPQVGPGNGDWGLQSVQNSSSHLLFPPSTFSLLHCGLVLSGLIL